MVATVGAVWATAASAQQTPSQVQAWYRTAAGLNRPALAEPAGSHGSMGLAMGAGVSRHDGVAPSPLATTELGDDGEALDAKRIWLVKGMPWPVDLLFTGASGPRDTFTQATGVVQWNVFERMGLPAVSIRGGIGRLYGFDSTEAEATSLDAAASFGFLRYFTVFGSAGVTRHTVGLNAAPAGNTSFLLMPGEGAMRFERTWIERSYTMGLKVVAWPPFLAVTAEAAYAEGEPRGGSLEVSFGI